MKEFESPQQSGRQKECGGIGQDQAGYKKNLAQQISPLIKENLFVKKRFVFLFTYVSVI